MAVIVRVNADALADAIGMHLTVIEPVTMPNGAAGWTMDRPRCVTLANRAGNRDGAVYDEGSKLWFDRVPDAWLQPIRGPEQAETVRDIINQAIGAKA